MRAPKGPRDPLELKLRVAVTGVLVLRFDDLAPVVEAAVRASEMRPFGLVALRARNDRHGRELPVRRAAAARLRARRLPFKICHDCRLSPDARSGIRRRAFGRTPRRAPGSSRCTGARSEAPSR